MIYKFLIPALLVFVFSTNAQDCSKHRQAIRFGVDYNFANGAKSNRLTNYNTDGVGVGFNIGYNVKNSLSINLSPSYTNFNLTEQYASLYSNYLDPDRARNLSDYSGGEVSFISAPLTVQWHWFSRTFFSPYFIFGPTINQITTTDFVATNISNNQSVVLEKGESTLASGRVLGFGANFNLSKNVSIFAERIFTRLYSNEILENPGFNQTKVGLMVKLYTTKPKDCKKDKPYEDSTPIESISF